MSSSSSSSKNSTDTKYETQTIQGSTGNIVTRGDVTVTDQGAVAAGAALGSKAIDANTSTVKDFGENTLTALGKVLDFTTKTQDYAQRNTENLLNSATRGNANALNAVTEAKRSEASSSFTSLAKTLGLAVVGVIGIAVFFILNKNKGG